MNSIQQVADWRRAERDRLIQLRLGLPVADRQEASRRIVAGLEAHVAERGLLRPDTVVSGYWPLRGEPDVRPWLTSLHERGHVCVLPVVVEKGTPLRFRRWSPGCEMERGVWNIPVPIAREEFIPDVLLAPVVGYDSGRYRLGYGGGYFDRTLAMLKSQQRSYYCIGIALDEARLETIHPQQHDIALDAIVTPTALIQ